VRQNTACHLVKKRADLFELIEVQTGSYLSEDDTGKRGHELGGLDYADP
jgi:hypothetical protein